MKNNKLLLVIVICGAFAFAIPAGCSKTATPQPPIHDTVTLVRNDTTINTQTDTLYGSKPDSTVNLTRGLLLYLPFSGSIADSSGNANPTQALNGASLTYDAHGYANNAFGGNGYNQVIQVTNNGSIVFDTALSVSVDFMTTDLNTRHAFLTMVNYVDGSGPSFGISTSIPANTSLFDVGMIDNSIGCSNYGPNINPLTDTTAFVPVLGAWYNAIATFQSGTLNVYINGTLIGTKVTTLRELNLCPTASVIVGGWWSGDPIGLAGEVDNVRIYNRVLTPHEIAALASNYQVTSNSQRPALRTAPVHKRF
jgi:hypothetical protein